MEPIFGVMGMHQIPLNDKGEVDPDLYMERVATLGKKHGLPVVVDEGWPCLATFHFEHELADPLRTLYTQQMLQRGFLAGCILYATLAHTGEVVARYDQAIDEVFGEISGALEAGKVEERLLGPVAHSGFRRLV